MAFKFNVNLTEQDYLDFNVFAATKTPHGKGSILRTRLILTAIVVVATLLTWLSKGVGRTSIVFTVLSALILLYFQLYLVRRMKNSLKSYINGLKKQGKLPYSPYSTMEFNDESIIETDENGVTERKYSVIEAISIDKNAVYVFIGAAQAFILPFSSFESREQMDAFIEFISAKCPNIVRY